MRQHFSWQSGVVGADLESSTKLVLLVIGTYMNQHGDGAFPSYKSIAEAASLGRATVIRHVELAVAAGWLTKRIRFRASGPEGRIESDSNAYNISFPPAPDTGGVVSQRDHLVSQEDQGGITVRPPVVSQRDPNTPVLTPQLTPLLSPTGDEGEIGGRVESKSGTPNCPHQAIVEAWHRILPELQEVHVWGEDRRKHLATRWKAYRERQELSWWEGLFEHIRASDFLMGRRTEFVLTLPWLVKSEENLVKVIEGNYHGSRGGA